MTEFEWLRQMRELRQPLAPQRDLWGAIDAALDDVGRSGGPVDPVQRPPRATPRRHWLLAVSLAALVVVVCGIAWHLQQAPANVPIASNNATPQRIGERRVGKECRSRWSPYH